LEKKAEANYSSNVGKATPAESGDLKKKSAGRPVRMTRIGSENQGSAVTEDGTICVMGDFFGNERVMIVGEANCERGEREKDWRVLRNSVRKKN